MICTCPHLNIGTEVLASKNWDPDCEEHGIKSAWYNNGEETKIRNAKREKTVALQLLAGMRRRGEISQDAAQEMVKTIEKDYTDATE